MTPNSITWYPLGSGMDVTALGDFPKLEDTIKKSRKDTVPSMSMSPFEYEVSELP